MKTSRLLFSAALFAGSLGIVCLFLPQELGRALGSDAAGTALAVQLVGAVLLAFGLLNWMSRTLTVGGIYGRPVVMANLIHFNTGFLVFFKAALAAQDPLVPGCGAAIYGLFALAFWSRLFSPATR